MATLVLAGAGAAIGSAIGGPAGAFKGFQIGAAVGSVAEAIMNQPHGNGMLKDLKYSGSSYVVPITRFWGTSRVGGNIIWTAKDSNGNTLVQHTHSQSILGGASGGFGGSSQNSTYYTATLAVQIGVGTHTFPDGSQVYRPVNVLRIWADSKLVYSSSAIHTLSMSGSTSGGTYTLTFDHVTTPPLPYNATAAQIQAALEALSTVGAGNVAVSGGLLPQYPVVITFKGALYNTSTGLDITSSVTGGTATLTQNLTNTMQLQLGHNLEIYPGSESQTADPTMQASLGASNTPAYRGTAYCVIQNMDLTDFGQRIPSFQFEVDNGPVFVSDAISDLIRYSGVPVSAIDVSAASAITLQGLVESNQSASIDTINPLLLAYNLDLIDVDGYLRLVARGGAVTTTVNALDYGTDLGNKQQTVTQYSRTRLMRWDLPGTYQITYHDVNANYETGMQQDHRQLGNVQNIVQLDLTGLTLDANSAKVVASTQLDYSWTEQDSFEFYLPWKYINIAPADILSIPLKDGGYARVRVTEMELALEGLLHIYAVLDGAQNATQVLGGSSGSGPTLPPSIGIPTVWTQWSGYEVQDVDQAYPGIYIAAAAENGDTRWRGCTVYYSLDGTNYVAGPTITSPSAFGVTTTALGSGGAVAGSFDTTNTVGVDLTASWGALASVSESEVLGGQNHALIGDEIVGAATDTLTGAYLYTLSDIRRGERSTAMTGHASGERFIAISPAISRINFTPDQVGSTVYLKCLSPGQALTDVTAQTCVILAATPTALQTQVNGLTTTVSGISVVPNWLSTPQVLWSAQTVPAGYTTFTGPTGAKEVLLETVVISTSSGSVALTGRATGGSIIYNLNSEVEQATGVGATNQVWLPCNGSAQIDLQATGNGTVSARILAYR